MNWQGNSAVSWARLRSWTGLKYAKLVHGLIALSMITLNKIGLKRAGLDS